jgi:Aspartyl protease
VRFEFTSLPGSPSDIPRPAIEVSLDGPTDRLNLLALVDTGALYNRFGAWVADSLNIDLDGVPVAHIGLGGHTIAARTVIVSLTIGGYTWEAPVSFCDPWPFAFHLLGQEGFLRWFTVMINAADRTVDIHPIEK